MELLHPLICKMEESKKSSPHSRKSNHMNKAFEIISTLRHSEHILFQSFYKHFIKSSGVPALDKSVQKTLNDVKSIVPFPEGAKDHERRFDINFNLKAKRLSA